jgi:uncharacterized membrane protein YqjE
VIRPLGTLLASVAGLAEDRIALLGTELREELGRFALLLLAGCAVIVFAALALAAASAALLLAAGDYRVAAAVIIALLFGGVTAFVAWQLRASLARQPVAFAASRAELERDRRFLVERGEERRVQVADSGAQLMRLVSIGVLAYTVVRRLRRAP